LQNNNPGGPPPVRKKLIKQGMRKAISGNIGYMWQIHTDIHTYIYIYSPHVYTRHIKSTLKVQHLSHPNNVDVGFIETIEITNPQCTPNVLLDVH